MSLQQAHEESSIDRSPNILANVFPYEITDSPTFETGRLCSTAIELWESNYSWSHARADVLLNSGHSDDEIREILQGSLHDNWTIDTLIENILSQNHKRVDPSEWDVDDVCPNSIDGWKNGYSINGIDANGEMKNGTDGYGWRIRTTIEVDHDMKTAPCRLCFEIRDQYADENRGKMLRKIEWTNLETETTQTNEEFVESPLPYDLRPIWRDIISENIESVIESQFVEVA